MGFGYESQPFMRWHLETSCELECLCYAYTLCLLSPHHADQFGYGKRMRNSSFHVNVVMRNVRAWRWLLAWAMHAKALRAPGTQLAVISMQYPLLLGRLTYWAGNFLASTDKDQLVAILTLGDQHLGK